MSPYILIAYITIFFVLISFFIEWNSPTYKLNIKRCNLLGLSACRFVHYYLSLYFVLFFVLFRADSVDSYLYLFAAFGLTYSWMFFECCMISYYELCCYGVNHHDFNTTFHPCLYVFFRDAGSIPLSICGLVIFFTFYWILAKNRNIRLEYKIALGAMFAYLFSRNLTTRDSSTKYPVDKNHVMYWF